jgi:hypothetical protein
VQSDNKTFIVLMCDKDLTHAAWCNLRKSQDGKIEFALRITKEVEESLRKQVAKKLRSKAVPTVFAANKKS